MELQKVLYGSPVKGILNSSRTWYLIWGFMNELGVHLRLRDWKRAIQAEGQILAIWESIFWLGSMDISWNRKNGAVSWGL